MYTHPVRNPRFASFRTQPLENLSAAVKLPVKKGLWATQPLEQILVAEFLLCELGVHPSTPSPPTKSLDFRGFDSNKLLILRGGNYHIHIIV